MPRKQREKSATGIYHVMIRGINKQNIFFDSDDFAQMQWALIEAPRARDPLGRIVHSDECRIYAYCILNNHVHILIEERKMPIARIMQKIEDRYVFFYNKKYDRCGHLFQDRFRSEPVNDIAYFKTLLRYIHRNPVKAMECNAPEDYNYSSWREYLPHLRQENELEVILPSTFRVIDHYFRREELIEWVNMDVNDECMDMDSEKFVLTDQHAWAIISDISGESNPEAFKILDQDTQLRFLSAAIQSGITLRQAERLSSLSRYLIAKYVNTPTTESKDTNPLSEQTFTKGSDPLVKVCSDKVKENQEYGDVLKEKMDLVISLIANGMVDCSNIAEEMCVSDSYCRRLLRIMVEDGILKFSLDKRRKCYELNGDVSC